MNLTLQPRRRKQAVRGAHHDTFVIMSSLCFERGGKKEYHSYSLYKYALKHFQHPLLFLLLPFCPPIHTHTHPCRISSLLFDYSHQNLSLLNLASFLPSCEVSQSSLLITLTKISFRLFFLCYILPASHVGVILTPNYFMLQTLSPSGVL